jgi:hypothetical protein
MLLAAKVVSDIPEVGSGLAGHAFATLDVLGYRFLSAAVATDIGAYRGPGDSAADRSKIVTASVSNLVPENTADDCSGNRAGNGVVSTLCHLFALDPASLSWWPDHRAH